MGSLQENKGRLYVEFYYLRVRIYPKLQNILANNERTNEDPRQVAFTHDIFTVGSMLFDFHSEN